jgi:hypothetical protein
VCVCVVSNVFVSSQVAMRLLDRQEERIRGLRPASSAVLEISFDESEVVASVDGEPGIYALCMMHAKLRWVEAVGGKCLDFNIVMAPAFLLGTTAEHLMAAITKRLPVGIRDLKRLVKRLSININSDGARACKRLARRFMGRSNMTMDGDGVVSVHSTCCMHATQAIVNAVFAAVKLSTALFCACVLLHHVKVFGGLKRRFFRVAIEQSEDFIVYTPPAPDKVAYVRALLEMSDWRSDQTYLEGKDGPILSPEKQARASFLDRVSLELAASEFDGDRIAKLRKYCPYGCCANLEIAREKMIKDVGEALLAHAPQIPACNRWERMFGPLCFWAVFSRCKQLVSSLADISQKDLTQEDGGPVTEADLIGPGDDNT